MFVFAGITTCNSALPYAEKLSCSEYRTDLHALESSLSLPTISSDAASPKTGGVSV